ncbi:CYTH domain-containing protein [Halomonas sp. YLGW01]|uniref:CYTH domain-containing protein n=1 Tax=Halomonas sp. YLGW01 TaxID=2773308 RepID=UPI001785FEDE|nr:CYTH domain-containing protein [Halomonas sp. YLGW01]
MSQEIELKLALPPEGPERLRRHPRLMALPAEDRTLANTYYDTPDGALEAARVALRIRDTGNGRVQTLKTTGSGQGGLSVRGEWEWPIDADRLDLDGLRPLPPMQALGDEVLAALVPRFATDFARRTWLVDGEQGRIEVALDDGEVRAGGRRATIRELELELKDGDPTALWALAEELATTVPLRPASASKAARGASLGEGHWPLPAAGNDPAALYERAILSLDALADSQDGRFKDEARQSLDRLIALGDDRLTRPARTLREALDRPAPDGETWLDVAFGQAALALAHALYA